MVVLLAGAACAILYGQPGPAAAQGGFDFRGSIAPQPGPPAGTRPPDAPAAPPGQNGQLSLAALVADDGQRIDQGLVWRIFSASRDGARSRLVTTSREAQPNLRLPAGDYVVNVSFGRAYAIRRVKVAAGGQANEQLALNAGVLRLTAFNNTGERLNPADVRFEILADERDQFGQRPRIAGNLRPGSLIRLNSGLYHIVSVYGDANSVARTDLTVEPGKLTDISLMHSAAKVTFKLVQRSGGDALPDTHWTIATRAGQVVKDSAGALPVHILAPGTYTVNATTGGRVFRRTFTVRTGETAVVEVVMQ